MKRYEEKVKDIVTEFQRPAEDMQALQDKVINRERDKELVTSKLPKRLRFALADGSLITEVPLTVEILIGRRSRRNDPFVVVDLEDFGGHKSGVSRVHAMVGILRDKVIVQDLQSINGTLLDEQRLQPLKKYPLHDGAHLVLSKLHIVVTYIYE